MPGSEDPGVRPRPVGDQSRRERGSGRLGRPRLPPRFVLGGARLAGDFAACGEEYGEGLCVGGVQGDGQQGGAKLVDPMPGEVVRGKSPPQTGAQHRRVLHAIEHIDHEERLWRRVYPPTGREGLPPLAFVFADTTDAKVANTVAVLEEDGRRYWAPRRYDTYHRGITARDYSQAVPVVVTTLEQLQEDGADAAVWRRLGRTGEQTLKAALDDPDGDVLYRRQAARAEAEEEQRRSEEREARRPVCSGCGAKFTDQRWEETTVRGYA
ncbi:hypothetical protein [Streptomyces flavidovirens]|uniref:Uncharacterized protein n=1 Tax=Streptomyces flavidovirens TaxID=67298 RepID=A0ABW6RN50_9ACTN